MKGGEIMYTEIMADRTREVRDEFRLVNAAGVDHRTLRQLVSGLRRTA